MITGARLKAVLAALIVLTGLAWLYRDASSRQAVVTAGAEAVAAARDAIPAISSYQAATAEKDLPAAAKERLTGPFLDEFNQLITTVLVPEAKQRNLSASATVPAAGVVTAEAGHAVVLAYVDQELRAGAAPATRNNTSVRVTMDKVGGRWLISGFEPI